MSCGPNECPGAARCPAGEDCFAEHARRRADGADILVVNHALYLAHLAAGGTLLPHHEVVIVDEAHALADTATRALGSEVAPGGLRHLAARLRGAGAPPADADAVAEAAERLEDVLGDVDGRVDPTEGGSPASSPGPRSGSRPRRAESTSAATPPGPRRPPGWPRPASTRSAGSKRPAATKWLGSRAVSGRCCAWRPSTSGRAWLRCSSPTRRACSCPPRSDPVPGSSRSPAASGWSRPRTPPPSAATSRRVESPFDVRGQSLLYVPRALPDPRRDGWADAAGEELCALVAAAGGRALVLCTSRRAVERFAALLRDRTDHPVLAQGDAANAALLERFAAEETSCLVATRAFWQGVDVPGPACVLVVIDRVPFTRPDDPLEQARREAVERAGGSGFRDVDLPAAALVLAQGAGRLLRRRDDRGVVAVLDSRLATAGYRRVLLEALPPMRRTVERQAVVDFLQGGGET